MSELHAIMIVEIYFDFAEEAGLSSSAAPHKVHYAVNRPQLTQQLGMIAANKQLLITR